MGKKLIKNFVFDLLFFMFIILLSYLLTLCIFSGSPFSYHKNNTFEKESISKHFYFCEENKLNEQTEQIDHTYYRDDIPLDSSTQKDLFEATKEFDVDYELALAVIWKETNYRNVYGDGGDSVGYFQIQPRWVKNVMNELNITTLEDPKSNFWVGCKLLSTFISQYGVEEGLTRYNSGSPGKSKYATEVMEKWIDLKK